MSSEKISEILDIPDEFGNREIVKIEPEKKPSPIVVTDAEIQKDVREIRNNLKALIQTANDAMEGMLEVATEGGESRAYEVVGQLIQTALEANQRLLNLHTDGYKQVVKSQQAMQQKAENITNNTIYAGNTAELLAAMKKLKEEAKKQDAAEEGLTHASE